MMIVKWGSLSFYHKMFKKKMVRILEQIPLCLISIEDIQIQEYLHRLD